MIELLRKNGKFCTGCGACCNICPVQAITMTPDKDGFLHPETDRQKCVNCGLCEKTCPVLKPQYKNQQPRCYAVMAADEIRRTSSSGGIFTLVAEEIISRGGVVFGAAWKSDWSVAQIGVDSERELEKLRSSKYLQSDTGDSYREVAQALLQDRPVLYTGCPCQIAGLYAYLENRKKISLRNLYTAEIVCHGVPSYKAFRKYLDDNFSGKTISRIDFRDKKVFGWSTTSNIYFEDGSEYHKNERTDPYYQAFLPCMSMRHSCKECAFSRLPRQADISMGDFWGIDRYKKELNDRKGTSLLLVNNARGQELFGIIEKSAAVCEPVPLDYATHINKTILHPFAQHPGRKHFYSVLDRKPFNQLVPDALNHHYDVGIVGLWYGINYGSVLTYYALYSLLSDLGYDPVMLPKPNRLWEERFNDPGSIAQRFIWPRCNVFHPFRYQSDYVKFNDLCRNFVLGSDVVWNYGVCGKDVDQFFFLDWVESGHKKIAYAASFGNRLSGPENHVRMARYHMGRFDSLSVRESSGAEAARRECGRTDVANVLDPVFVCDPKAYEDAIQDAAQRTEAPFVFAYILRAACVKEKIQLLQRAGTFYHAEYKICGNPNEMQRSRQLYGDLVMPMLSVEDWLYHMKHCAMYIGDSYHGLCFALIFHRPFIIVYGREGHNASIERFASLLKLVGLEHRLLETMDDPGRWDELLREEIDWQSVDRKLAEAKEASLSWLRQAMEKPAAAPCPEDFFRDAANRRISQLETIVQLQNQRIEKLSVSSDPGFVRWFAGKVRGGIRCLKDNGVKYTLWRIGEKIRNKLK